MSSEKTASAVNILKGDLAAGWNLLEGSSADYTDLGVARRFGGAAAAYSLRDIGAMNGEVVRVRREPEDTTDGIDDEEKFSANQVQDGTLERWVNGKLEDTLPADVATAAAAYSLRKVKDAPSLVYTADFSSGNDGLVPNSSLLFLNSGGQTYQGKSNVLTFTSINSPSNPQLWLNNNNFLAGFSGSITFEYYVESDSPLVGNKWVVGSSLATYTKDGVTIVGGAWTTATVFFGSYYSGTDKYKTTTGIQEVGRILNAVDSNNQSVNCDVGEIVAFSSFTASVLSPSTQIRRSSDDIEVNVHFDSDGKISSNSLVSNVGEETTGSSSGSTTSTDLNAFLNETLTVGVAVEGGNGADRPDSFTNATNSSFTATVTEVAGGYFPYKTGAGDVITISFDLVLSGAASPSACTSTSVSTVNNASNTILYTSSGSYTSSFTCTADATHFRFADGDDGTFAVTNFQVTSHTHQAFVHTWYDQAGSNDAVQATAANQPKIAESGALLADGIDFDGSNDFLESTTLSSIYTGTDEAHSSFVVVNSDVASTTQYILGIGRTSSSNPLRNTLFHSGGNIGWQVRDDAGLLKTDLSANPYVANQTYLVSALNSGTTIDFNTNSVINDNGTDADVGASTINTVKIGALAVDSSSPLNGSIKEAIFYATDQSANRFKIESNINNYYGLYNDANDLSAAFDSNGTITNESKDGFTADVATFSHYVNATFNDSVATGETIYVSFNAQLAPNGGTSASPILRLQDAQVGSNTSNQSSISEGFNSIDLTATGTSDRVGFLEQDDNVDYIISNFKVSRIARNGFVETWYDQSGNGNNATQSSATIQPVIVSNGGLTKLNNQTPALGFQRNSSTDSRMQLSSEITGEPYTFITVGVARGAQPIHILRENATSTGTANRPQINIGKTNMSYASDPSTTSGNITVDGDNDFIASFLSSTNGGTADMRFNKSSVHTFTRGAAGNGIGFFGKFDNTSTPLTMVESWIVYESDLSSDIEEVENEITRPIEL